MEKRYIIKTVSLESPEIELPPDSMVVSVKFLKGQEVFLPMPEIGSTVYPDSWEIVWLEPAPFKFNDETEKGLGQLVNVRITRRELLDLPMVTRQRILAEKLGGHHG
jgi:hypothetical protein